MQICLTAQQSALSTSVCLLWHLPPLPTFALFIISGWTWGCCVPRRRLITVALHMLSTKTGRSLFLMRHCTDVGWWRGKKGSAHLISRCSRKSNINGKCEGGRERAWRSCNPLYLVVFVQLDVWTSVNLTTRQHKDRWRYSFTTLHAQAQNRIHTVATHPFYFLFWFTWSVLINMTHAHCPTHGWYF